MTRTAQVERHWFVLDDRGYLHRHHKEEDARHEAGKPGNERWKVHSQQVTLGPIEDHGGEW